MAIGPVQLIVLGFEHRQGSELVAQLLAKGQLTVGCAFAPVIGDHVSGDLVGPGVQPLLFAQPPHVCVEAQHDLLGQVVDGDAIGHSPRHKRAQPLVQFRPERLRRDAVRAHGRGPGDG